MSCPVPELNPDAAKLIIAVNGLSVAGLLVAWMGRFFELRTKLKNQVKVDESGLPYQLPLQHRQLLGYRMHLRISLLIIASMVGLGAVIVYFAFVAGDPKLLPDNLACWGAEALWLGVLFTVISILILINLLIYLMRLHGAVDENT